MHARMFAALATVAAIGAAVCVPALAQNAMPASASSTMMHGTPHKDAMHAHPSMPMQGTMRPGAMMKKQDAMSHHTMKKMQHDGAMRRAGSAPASSGG